MKRSIFLRAWPAILTIPFSVAYAASGWPYQELWPPVVALLVIWMSRQALTGLLCGGFAGAILLADGNVMSASWDLPIEHLVPGLQSPWKQGAVVFTLILGGFAAVLERGGGLATLLNRWAKPGRDAARQLETATAGLGLICFFDGLANSMIVGRVSKGLAGPARVAPVKLAYIVDSTSSAVACVALVSTWIAFQLGMIAEAYELAGKDVNPYGAFLASLPYNFHCWFTLILLFVAIRGRFNPGPMGRFVEHARGRETPEDTEATVNVPGVAAGPVHTALAPLAILMLALFVGFMILGSDGPIWPMTRQGIIAAFGSDAGPLVLVLASAIASVAAILFYPRRDFGVAGSAFLSGVQAMLMPILILLAAWALGSVMGALGTADLISGLLRSSRALWTVPALTFLTGAAISFSTGTSWGTMGILFPLAVPAAASLGAGEAFLHMTVAAVFSGAVFGDHCSPFSDTTIVSSISCGVEPHDHVRTQIPYALIAAAVALFVGFLPGGLGFPVWGSWILGAGVLLALPRIWPRKAESDA